MEAKHWTLTVQVPDLGVEKELRVSGDMHLGGVLYTLSNELECHNWSDHALFWPVQNTWLLRTKWTLDQYELDSDASLIFTTAHKTLRVQLPDFRCVEHNVDFSAPCLNVVFDLCRDLGIRHPEELSLSVPLESKHIKRNYQSLLSQSRDVKGSNSTTGSNASSCNSLDRPMTPVGTRKHSRSWTLRRSNGSASPSASTLGRNVANVSLNSSSGGVGGGGGWQSLNESQQSELAVSPQVSVADLEHALVRPRLLVERARTNAGWLGKKRSLMEQGVREFDTLCLRFKYYDFFDLNAGQDQVRINLLYEQAKWQILSGDIHCSEPEALLAAGLQLQVQLQSHWMSPSMGRPLGSTLSTAAAAGGAGGGVAGDVDDALDALESQLNLDGVGNGTATTAAAAAAPSSDIVHVPELAGYLRYSKQRNFALNSEKRLWCVCRDLKLTGYKSAESAAAADSERFSVQLSGCVVTPVANVVAQKYAVKLEVQCGSEMGDMHLKFESEEQYVKWLAAFQLASLDRTMADPGYDRRVHSIGELLALQRPSGSALHPTDALDIKTGDFLPTPFAKKCKPKHILHLHANVASYDAVTAKQIYIRLWQSLPGYGQSYFVVRFTDSASDEVLALSATHLRRINISTGDHIKTWRYPHLQRWNVNWDTRIVLVQFENDTLRFSCVSCDCEVFASFIGGYVFLSMRSKQANQQFDADQFFQLTSQT